MTEKYDLIVIGAGSGGIATARRAASYNKKVLVIEKSRIGGTCVNLGCVPKKISYNLAMLLEHLHVCKSYGIEIQSKLNFQDFVEKRDKYIERLNTIYHNLIKNAGIEYLEGYGELHDGCVTVNGQTYEFENCLLATGTHPTPLQPKLVQNEDSKRQKTQEIKGIEFLKTSDDFFDLKEVPKKCVIIGSGYIAVELSFILKEIGSQVHVIARGSKILSHFDNIIGENVHQAMTKKGIQVHFNTSIKQITENTINLEKEDREEKIEDVDFFMCCIGREPDLSYIKTEIKTKNKFLEVNKNFETSIKNVYAVGDLIGPNYMLTPVAIYCGRILADHLFYESKTDLIDYHKVYLSVPSAIFSHPPCASIGLSEEDARKMTGEVKVHSSKFVNLFFGICADKEDSVFKIVTLDKKVVGLHMFGMGSDEIVQGFSVAMKMGATFDDFKAVIGVHPTAAEEVITMK